jgi:hypothetical protein
MFLKDVADFKEHTEHVANQFREVKNLKENLPNGHVIVSMENDQALKSIASWIQA